MANINALSPLWIPQANFNEVLYLQRFPDIALLVKVNLVPSGWAHYIANVESEPFRNIPGLNMVASSVSGSNSVTPTVPIDMGIPASSPLPTLTKSCCGSCSQGLPCEGEKGKHPLERFEWILWVVVGLLLAKALWPSK